MKKLNNKGLTAIEVLVCFAIISVLVISMLNIVNNYKDKQNLESYKSSIMTYKSAVTKVIYDDIIKNKGVVSFTSVQTEGSNISNPTDAHKENIFEYEITLKYINNKTAKIKIHNTTLCFKYIVGVGNRKEKGESGLPCTPEIADNIDNENSKYYIQFTASDGTIDKFTLPKINGLKYNEINPKESDKNIINIKIGLYHVDLGTKYDVVNIITPNVSVHSGMLG